MLFLTFYSSLASVSANEFIDPEKIVNITPNVDSENKLTEKKFEVVAQNVRNPVYWRGVLTAGAVGGFVYYVSGNSPDTWIKNGFNHVEPKILVIAKS